jgi:hypothetical protein
MFMFVGSVVDPDVFGPPGSGSLIICTDPDLDPDLIRYTFHFEVIRIQTAW